MGTRSTTVVYDDNVPLINLYAQYDGYPSGHGADLAKILKDRRIVNGFGLGDNSNVSNGMSCLAATIVASLKNRIGNYYLESVKSTDFGQDYEYHIYNNQVVVKDHFEGTVLFDGTWNEFAKFCELG